MSILGHTAQANTAPKAKSQGLQLSGLIMQCMLVKVNVPLLHSVHAKKFLLEISDPNVFVNCYFFSNIMFMGDVIENKMNGRYYNKGLGRG